MPVNDDEAVEVSHLLTKVSPLECDALGPSIVDDISRGRPASEFVIPPGGAFLDLTLIIMTITALANLAVALLRVREEILKTRVAGAAEATLATLKNVLRRSSGSIRQWRWTSAWLWSA